MTMASLKSLRITGRNNISIVNNLLDRMPNFTCLDVSIFPSFESDVNEVQYIKQHDGNNSLINLTIRLYDMNELGAIDAIICSKLFKFEKVYYLSKLYHGIKFCQRSM
ncbi:unnamed protein product [Rotaria magnacalcarata]|uniref:Uncharacterized protein n=3 Tax=Rotaria magnacalcarata TaxID=392030 RepID=A0A816AMY7_9BILA|nr:unnamed protein product [Rotaria magnacalcarata]